jgi:3,4-dihydroxy 2-butanone 4-phosphate synthase/GTP cyclohydrolase II
MTVAGSIDTLELPVSDTSGPGINSPKASRSNYGEQAVPLALAALAAGRPVLLIGSDGRHGDLLAAAESMTPDLMAFIVRHSSGFVCVALDEERADALGLPAQAAKNQNRRGTAFGVTVDAMHGISTGISAADRSHTVRLLAAPDTTSADFSRPGHIVTLRAVSGGVFARQGHAEAAVDLTRLAGCAPIAVLADLVLDDFGFDRPAPTAKRPKRHPAEDSAISLVPPTDVRLVDFMSEHGIHCVSVTELLAYRNDHERLVERAVQARVPIAAGAFTAVGYRSTRDDLEHVAFVHGDVNASATPVSVYVHRESLIADVFGAPTATPTLEAMLQRVVADGAGVVVYLRSADGGATGLVANLQRMFAAENGVKALPLEAAAAQTALLARQILDDLGVGAVRLLSAAHTLAPQRQSS